MLGLLDISNKCAHIYAHMRTTIEIPDPLFRQAKRVAVERGTTLREFVTLAVVHELEGQQREKPRLRMPLPSVNVPVNSPILHMTPQELAQVDDDEELARHHEIRR